MKIKIKEPMRVLGGFVVELFNEPFNERAQNKVSFVIRGCVEPECPMHHGKEWADGDWEHYHGAWGECGDMRILPMSEWQQLPLAQRASCA